MLYSLKWQEIVFLSPLRSSNTFLDQFQQNIHRKYPFLDLNFFWRLWTSKIPDAARIAVSLMLQETFENPLTNLLSVYACWKWLNSESKDEILVEREKFKFEQPQQLPKQEEDDEVFHWSTETEVLVSEKISTEIETFFTKYFDQKITNFEQSSKKNFLISFNFAAVLLKTGSYRFCRELQKTEKWKNPTSNDQFLKFLGKFRLRFR